MQSSHFSMIGGALSATLLSLGLAACGGGETAPVPVTPPVVTVPEVPLDPPITKGCENGAVISALTPDAGFARAGSVFSRTLYQISGAATNSTHQPQKIRVQVSLNGKPLAGCHVAWVPQQGAADGWVFPDAPVSDASGTVSAWWTAGAALAPSLNVNIQQKDGVIKSTKITGSVMPHQTRGNSIHIWWTTPNWDKFSAEVTPMTWEPTTYYEVIGFDGGYTGIQNHQLLFSLWDVNGVRPEVIDSGISRCSVFGGEGTGIKCESPFVSQINVTYRFELEVADALGNKQDYTVYFTDTSDNQRKKLATIRMPRPQKNAGAYGFVEDWGTLESSCVANNPRIAYFSNVKYLDRASAQWINVKNATGTAVYAPNNNEICSNYQHSVEGTRFKLSSGGSAVGYPLHMPGGPINTPLALP